MSNPKLVVIDTKTHECKAYEGRSLVEKATFSRALETDEVEAFRVGSLVAECSEDCAA